MRKESLAQDSFGTVQIRLIAGLCGQSFRKPERLTGDTIP
jgi:hypothetical protein